MVGQGRRRGGLNSRNLDPTSCSKSFSLALALSASPDTDAMPRRVGVSELSYVNVHTGNDVEGYSHDVTSHAPRTPFEETVTGGTA